MWMLQAMPVPHLFAETLGATTTWVIMRPEYVPLSFGYPFYFSHDEKPQFSCLIEVTLGFVIEPFSSETFLKFSFAYQGIGARRLL